MTEHTPTPWDWMIHDHSMASLGVMPDPGLGNPLVLAVSPCPSCADRAEPREWKWGRCHTPSEADAEFILTAVNNHYGLLELAAEAMWKRHYPNGGSIYKKYGSLSLKDKELHRADALKAIAITATERHHALDWKLLGHECPRCQGAGRVGIMACNDCGATGRAFTPHNRSTSEASS